jgi:Golgi nucleoside diphosphatase
MSTPEFEILHFSYRPSICEKTGHSWYILNLVFRAYDEFFIKQCLKESKEWTKIEVTTDIIKAQDYLDKLIIEFTDDKVEYNGEKAHKVIIDSNSEYKRDEVFIDGYEYHMNPLLKYKEKFDIFQYREFIQINPATKGIISYIEDIKASPVNSRFLDFSQFLCSIKALDLFWD